MGKKLKIFFQSMDGWGHISACIGLAQAFAIRGHEIVFLTNALFAGTFEKYGFREIFLKSVKKDEQMAVKENQDGRKVHPMKTNSEEFEKFRQSGFLSGRSSFEKLDQFSMDNEQNFWKMIYDDTVEMHPQLEQLLIDENPDLIFLDYFTVPPCIIKGNKPWIMINSANPLFFLESPDLPPLCSGYPSYDRSKWPEFNEKLDKTLKLTMRHYQNELMKVFGYDPILKENEFLLKSPYMNIYGYPEELDYLDIIGKLPEKFMRVDAFCRDAPDNFELPEEFKTKIKPDDKLIYLSMGSFGSFDYNLMKKITENLSESPHKYIVSKGAAHEMYELPPDNMWGQAFLPQTKILPLVDMVITHGGNNTVTETFINGKPMLVLPLFGDQYDNAQRVQEKKFGYRLDAYNHTRQEINQTIDKILNDQELIERCKKAAERIRKANSKQKACEKIEKLFEEEWKTMGTK